MLGQAKGPFKKRRHSLGTDDFSGGFLTRLVSGPKLRDFFRQRIERKKENCPSSFFQAGEDILSRKGQEKN